MARKKDKLGEVSERISKLKQKQAEIDKELASAKQEADELKPVLTCLRCGFSWQARSIEHSPNYCARCHSAGWNRPPRARNSRRPSDAPNPRWLGLAATPESAAPPCDPAPALVSSAVLPDLPLWDPQSERLTLGLPPLPTSLDYPPFPTLPTLALDLDEEEERQPEHTAMPRRDQQDQPLEPEPEPDDPPAPEPTTEPEL